MLRSPCASSQRTPPDAGNSEAAQRADGDRVIAPKDEWKQAFCAGRLDLTRDSPARLQDLVEEVRAFGAARLRLGEGSLDVPVVLYLDTRRDESIV